MSSGEEPQCGHHRLWNSQTAVHVPLRTATSRRFVSHRHSVGSVLSFSLGSRQLIMTQDDWARSCVALGKLFNFVEFQFARL